MKGLKLGLSLTGGSPKAGNLFCDAISQRRYVTAQHGNQAIKLAPHVVYTQGGSEWVAGIEAGGQKFRSWRTAKLSNASITAEVFVPDAGFDPEDPQFGSEIVCRIFL